MRDLVLWFAVYTVWSISRPKSLVRKPAAAVGLGGENMAVGSSVIMEVSRHAEVEI